MRIDVLVRLRGIHFQPAAFQIQIQDVALPAA